MNKPMLATKLACLDAARLAVSAAHDATRRTGMMYDAVVCRCEDNAWVGATTRVPLTAEDRAKGWTIVPIVMDSHRGRSRWQIQAEWKKDHQGC